MRGVRLRTNPPFFFETRPLDIIEIKALGGKMSEFTFEDGRKAEKVENNLDSMTKVIEVYVEPKPEKKLAQRITERFCVCEREIDTIDELTGEIVNKVVEKVCAGGSYEVQESKRSKLFAAVEEKANKKTSVRNIVFAVAILAQIAVLAYVIFG
jgi:hypothetical protein